MEMLAIDGGFLITRKSVEFNDFKAIRLPGEERKSDLIRHHGGKI
jgi:hypothetical protein